MVAADDLAEPCPVVGVLHSGAREIINRVYAAAPQDQQIAFREIENPVQQ